MTPSRGSMYASRLANYHPQRFIAFAFLAMSYSPPIKGDFSMDALLAMSKQIAGYELYGYWLFLAEPGADALIESHVCRLTSSQPALILTQRRIY